MPTLTDNAATEIRNLTADPELPEGFGMRIANDPASNALALTLVPTPAAGDQVLEDGAACSSTSRQPPCWTDQALDAARRRRAAVSARSPTRLTLSSPAQPESLGAHVSRSAEAARVSRTSARAVPSGGKVSGTTWSCYLVTFNVATRRN